MPVGDRQQSKGKGKKRGGCEIGIVERGKLEWAMNEKPSKGCCRLIFRSQAWQWAWCKTVRTSSSLENSEATSQPGSIPRFSMMIRCLEILTNRESKFTRWLHEEPTWSMSRNLGKRTVYTHPIPSLFSGVAYGSSYFHQFQPLRVTSKIYW